MFPNLIIIGAQKCATTSIHYYLSLHPQVFMSRPKELNFFINEHNLKKGLAWYQYHFQKPATIKGEASPLYTNFPEYVGIAQRMHAHVPNAKLLYIVRDPIRRIISNYIHNYADHIDNRTFVDAMAPMDANPYVDRSRYCMQLEQFLAFYPRHRILLIALEDLARNPRIVMQRIFQYLNVDHTFFSRRFFLRMHSAKYKRRKNALGLRLMNHNYSKLLAVLPIELQGILEKLLFLPLSKKVPPLQIPPDLMQNLKKRLIDDTDQLRWLTGNRFEYWTI